MPPHPVFKAGNSALITGAGSGIGLAVAKLCHSNGMNLALVDRNSEALSEARSQFNDGSDTKTYAMDVSKIDEWSDLRAKVEMDFGQVSFLMLNAGIGLKSGWEDTDYFQKIMDTNLFGVINGISTFLPSLRTQKQPTSIVITGSKQGITNPPGNPAYNASKAAIKTLAEHLSYDLRATPTSVHLLVPGWTFTGLTGGGKTKEKPEGAWAPEQVAEYLQQKMAEEVFYVICPDNDVTVEKDRKRMLWSVGDIVNERPPLSRWREGYKDDADEWMSKQKV
ncbi:MAG: hypothetical protein ALECFALPRED_006174 [Alectoria fallacina]|uniref:20beta-hydroxysteroid dehydrogenase n=1 Tax=Alectoria fallacina TaxID=1903189 RepID=A0A8H3G1F1_9LECA|nr:MAG: hypothetical protein ALECFALPRED_006174 [Alectoria fallacina]